ncbi:inositol-1-monophosphatase [Bifidobacterium minimum]|jgi:myo-inositol-1(or 4)-monophosphatase|uniref:Inositol-1-monophosphatase n=1 Tax=Bifidobacterium minimum TaxID=1693 RepID=A0A087BN62_9BIFI|nr:inositol monophosphatase family protein [Bifidobacterium minimum]KFI72462.1 inositol-1-monophosphatase [Bifidobacterium minimum]MCH4158778.1 inositol monophosphatase family protein [Bifidobacterium minimum]
MDLRELAMEMTTVVHEAGRHALQYQMTPHDLSITRPSRDEAEFTPDIDHRLVRYLEDGIGSREPFNGFWRNRPEQCSPWERYWCVGGVDGGINFVRNMAEWTVTVSLFEFNENLSAQPIIGIVHAPALGLTYVAARRQGAVRIRTTPVGEKRDKVMPSMMATLEGSVVSYGMSVFPEESLRALNVVSAIAGKPADIKRVGPASLDLCRVADGTYDAYFEPHLHRWDVPAVSAGTVVVWEAQGKVRQWNDDEIHWRRENDIVASNGLIIDELRPYLA